MALLADIDDSYTKTGNGTLTRWANKASLIPFVGGAIAWPLGMLGTVIESAQFLFRGQFGSAATALAAGTVGNAVNGLSGTFGSVFDIAAKPLMWWGNAASGVATGATLGTHARAATEALIGGVSGALGSKPQVLRSYPAGIGSIRAAATPQGPGKFTAGVSASRGEDANAAYARYMSGEGGVHVNELQSANGRGA
jgi:hypothetical protein